MKRAIEALLIATHEPLSLKNIVEILHIEQDAVIKHIAELNDEYRAAQRAFEIKEIAGGFQIYTLPEFAEAVSALHERKTGLSKAALETLAIIAYHQPLTRAEIEKLRGVDSTGVLDTLLQKALIKICGRLPVPGRPIKYGTTQEFLRYFGINDLSDLPREEDFSERAADMYQETAPEPTLVVVPNTQETDAEKKLEHEVEEENLEEIDKLADFPSSSKEEEPE